MPLDRKVAVVPGVPADVALISQSSLDVLLPYRGPETFHSFGHSSQISWWEGSKGSFLTTESVPISPLPTSLICGAMPTTIERISPNEWLFDGSRLSPTRVLRTPFIPKAMPHLMVSPEIEEQLSANIGRGPGLTPEGDDVLAGFLIAARSLGVDHALTSSDWNQARTTSFSSALLNAAFRGFAISTVYLAVQELRVHGSIVKTRSALIDIGSSSGAAMLLGMELAGDSARRAA